MDRLRHFGFLLAELSRRYVQLFEQLAQGTGLKLTTCRALAYLERHEGISQSRLAELAAIEPMALVRLLDRLQDEGMVQRLADPEDRRAHRLVLCEPARPVLRQIREISRRAREQVFAGIEPAESEEFLRVLERLNDNLGGTAAAPVSGTQLRPEDAPSRPARRVPRPRRARPPRRSSS
ncbi:MarR family winged helix-turn-helix transcriptional regulator [Thiomonas sp. FB-6]|uniref:MarR family winged helix-turn-helix transcriptional regulator n=1 Tax=Thiomonas sp. FB-6 TaxID=1158291 RepID=UPI000361A2CC|nr:MarR family transcriptional regulator [Thiomonas sp. FB-6]